MPPGKLLVDVPTALNAVTGTFVDTAQPAAIDTICCSNGRRARLMDRIQVRCTLNNRPLRVTADTS